MVDNGRLLRVGRCRTGAAVLGGGRPHARRWTSEVRWMSKKKNNQQSGSTSGKVKPPEIRNKRAKFDFEILEKIEAGIALVGSEVKSLRAGKASLEEAFAQIRDNEMYLRDFTIQPYTHASVNAHIPTRERKLLLHRREINKWNSKVTQKGFTLVPLSVYFNDEGRVKVKIGLAKGKSHADKRQDIKARDQKREMDRAMKNYR